MASVSFFPIITGADEQARRESRETKLPDQPVPMDARPSPSEVAFITLMLVAVVIGGFVLSAIVKRFQ